MSRKIRKQCQFVRVGILFFHFSHDSHCDSRIRVSRIPICYLLHVTSEQSGRSRHVPDTLSCPRFLLRNQENEIRSGDLSGVALLAISFSDWRQWSADTFLRDAVRSRQPGNGLITHSCGIHRIVLRGTVLAIRAHEILKSPTFSSRLTSYYVEDV